MRRQRTAGYGCDPIPVPLTFTRVCTHITCVYYIIVAVASRVGRSGKRLIHCRRIAAAAAACSRSADALSIPPERAHPPLVATIPRSRARTHTQTMAFTTLQTRPPPPPAATCTFARVIPPPVIPPAAATALDDFSPLATATAGATI